MLTQAEAEGLTLLKAKNKAGYFGVHRNKAGYPKPYQAGVRHGGKLVYLGVFATAAEAALCIARSPEGQAAYKRAAATESSPSSLTSEEALQRAEEEGLTLLSAKNQAGYFGVHRNQSCKSKSYEAKVSRAGKSIYLGLFATAEEAALCIARSPEGRMAAEKALSAPAPSLTAEEARQQAHAEGLVLRVADNKAGYFGVCRNQKPKTKAFEARVSRAGRDVYLGSFATPEEVPTPLPRPLLPDP